jgi:hypothetical protein
MGIKMLVGKPQRKSPLARPRRRWEDNITWILKEWGVKRWTGLNIFRTGSDGLFL